MYKNIIAIIGICFFLPTNLGAQKKNMNYTYPYANQQLNSFVNREILVKGVESKRFKHNWHKYSVDNISFLYNLNDSQVIIDKGHTAIIFDIKKKRPLGFNEKFSDSFLYIENNTYFTWAFGKLYKYNKPILKGERNNYLAAMNSQVTSGVIKYFCPLQDNYLVGLFFKETNNYASHYILMSNEYFRKTFWQVKLYGNYPLSATDLESNIILATKDIIHVVNQKGKKIRESKREATPIQLSIGPDGLMYMICLATGIHTKTEGTYLRVMDKYGNVKWEHKLDTHIINQPPIISNNGMAYIIQNKKLEAFSKRKKVWEYTLSNKEKSQKATVLKNGNILISNGSQVLYLNKYGKPIWIYNGKKKDIFQTPPILDNKKRVIVATAHHIVVIK